MMNWFERHLIRHAACLYARRLPIELIKGWGRSDYYTPEQIKAAIKQIPGEKRYAIIAYAAFLKESDFNKLIGTQSVLSYEEARKLFFRYVDKRFVSPYAYNPMTEAEAISRYEPH